MPQPTTKVTFETRSATQVAEQLAEPAGLVRLLKQRGLLGRVGELVRVRRPGGYCGLGGWLVLFLYFASGIGGSLKDFWKMLKPHALQVAALAGRKGLPSSSALSRLLARAETELLRSATWRLLLEISECEELLRHPAIQSYDAKGKGWHIFDVDPTMTTLYRRALPAAFDLPEPLTRADQMGAPGYAGRKRGDLQFCSVAVQHAGSALWVHEHLSPGNGKGVVDLTIALEATGEVCEHFKIARDAAVARLDGAFGNVPCITAIVEHGFAVVVRLNRPALYESPEVLEQLRAATWYPVPDSGCGPRRAAADIGWITLTPSAGTTRPDGSDYEPVKVRVVASIFPKSGKAKRGRVIDGWQVELFATTLPADAWPAPDFVATYFGRSAEENRFAQEDRELGLDHIFSYHLPGQELAVAVGLTVWNLRVARGFDLERPPVERPAQQLRCDKPDERVPACWPRDPVIQKLLDQLEWDSLLSRRPGWHWKAEAHELRCADGRILELTSVRPKEHAKGRTGIIFRRPKAGCENCEPRETCFQSWRHAASKHAEFSVPTSIATKLRKRRGQLRAAPTLVIEPIVATPGPQLVHHPLFLPAEARHVLRECFDGAALRIDVELPPPKPAQPRLIAVDVAARQHRRQTWDQKLARYALPDGARVDVALIGGRRLPELLGSPRGTGRTSRAAG